VCADSSEEPGFVVASYMETSSQGRSTWAEGACEDEGGSAGRLGAGTRGYGACRGPASGSRSHRPVYADQHWQEVDQLLVFGAGPKRASTSAS
jgi:hypothetical protein